MQDRPTAAELIDAVHEYLEQTVWPKLDGHAAFHMRVTLKVLETLRREVELGAAQDAAQRARLVELLGHDDADTLALERELVRGLRDGTIDAQRRDVRDHVRNTVREKLLVSNPGYLEE